MARNLSFHATRVQADPQDSPSISLEVEADGDPSTYFGMMIEDPDVPEVRISWGDGRESRDEHVVALTSASLAPTRLCAAFGESSGRYAGADVSFDALEEDDANALAAALTALASGLGSKLSISGIELAAPAKRAPELPRRRGAPMLGLLTRHEWRVAAGADGRLDLTLSNLGGPLDGGILVELGGAALERALVEPKSAAIAGAEAVFERRGNVATAALPDVRLLADLEIDRKANKKAPPPPEIALTVRITGASPGSGLFTVRVLVGTRGDRSGSALVGRTLVVGSE